MNSKGINLSGIFPPIPTAFTPAGEVHYEAQQANMRRWETAPLAGYVVGGSNGEVVSLSWEERVELVRFTRKYSHKDRLIIAGSGMHSTLATIELTHAVAEAGAQAALVVTPSYYKSRMDATTLIAYYIAVADASPIPVILYNVPANTSIDMTAGTIIELSSHPNIIGLKDSSGLVAKLGEICNRVGDDFQILSGSASSFLGAMAMGAVGAVSALANIAPEPLHRIWFLAMEGDFHSARALQLPLIEANNAITSRFGIAGLKAAMDLLGYAGGPPRLPLLPLSETNIAVLSEILAKADLLA